MEKLYEIKVLKNEIIFIVHISQILLSIFKFFYNLLKY